jgi:hypothetical protein
MIKTLLLLALIIPICLQSQIKKKVLFIGNSYTYVNSLPQLIYDLAITKQDTLVFDQLVTGGFTFNNHCANPQTWQKIRSVKWDYVVLQAQSQEPSFSPAQVASNTFPYAKQLCDSVKSAHPCSKILFFMTWGRKNGDAFNCNAYPPVCTYAGMQARLRQSYMMFKDSLKAHCAPVGVAWKTCRIQNPGIELYQPDESHPSMQGSYLAACVFYTSIFNKTSQGSTFLAGLNVSDVNILQGLASKTVLDSTDLWTTVNDIPLPILSASHNTVCTGQNFTIQASGAYTYTWNTGITSASIVSASTMPANLIFTLTAASATGCKVTNTISIQVFNCTTLNTLEASLVNEIQIELQYGNIKLTSQKETLVQCISYLGQHLKTIHLNPSNQFQVYLNDLKPGIYYFKTPHQILTYSIKD